MKKILTLLFTTVVVINAINAQEIDVNSFILKDSYELKGDEVKKDGNVILSAAFDGNNAGTVNIAGWTAT